MGVTYDGHARLTRYSAGTASQAMLYNGADERIRVVTTPAVGLADTRLYLYDLDHRIVGEYGPSGAADIKAEYIWTLPEVGASGPTGGDDGAGGYMPLATAVGQTGVLNWVHGHHLGTPILTTNAAGQAITPTGTAILGFPGQFANALLLSGAQHYYNRYRDYNFTTGRYIQADPIGLAGDDNPYAYAAGNPLRYTDPWGLETYWEKFTGLPDSYRVNAINAIAGWSDAYTFGITFGVRELIGANREVRTCSNFYIGGGIAGLISPRGAARTITKWFRNGKEFKLGKNLRIAPFGNRTSHPIGKWPHYHRRGGPLDPISGAPPAGQGIGRHRPWETKSNDVSFWDRF